MAKGIHINSKTKMSVYHATRKGINPPGRPVGVISVLPKGVTNTNGKYNNLVMYFVVSPYRKDFNTVIEQGKRRPSRKHTYMESLYQSCFKNWDKE